ncbi:choline uptake/conversion transcriptional regulator CudC [Tepidibacillus fermentans]|uniref:HTH-type transcriptional regulator n=1 Tax=Tepidibacillus fermentans TaxID=1281767 RepID=A0A4R3KL75_9BACI|nr:GbsR/MarR family transcriptional regulator [Tepidibacillus fermentans]TCS84352.1 DNA-binding transcriptional regulator GbsR (MarR family) [Tepidibacillus fermentans]
MLVNQGDIHLNKDIKRLEKARERVIHSITENMDLYGITDSVGRLYGILYFSERPLTLDEMREALGMSKTSMSTGVRTLLETNMVNKVWKKGVRKDLYQAEEDWYQVFFDFFSIKWKRAIELNLHAIQQSKKDYDELLNNPSTSSEIKEQVQTDLNKLTQAEEYYTWLTSLIKSFESKKIFEFIPKPSNKLNQNLE